MMNGWMNGWPLFKHLSFYRIYRVLLFSIKSTHSTKEKRTNLRQRSFAFHENVAWDNKGMGCPKEVELEKKNQSMTGLKLLSSAH